VRDHHRLHRDRGQPKEVYARVSDWAIVELRVADSPSTKHLVGCLVTHHRLVDQEGAPYIGSPLLEANIAERTGRTRRGRIVALIGDPLPPRHLPRDIRAMLRRAQKEWALPGEAIWRRVRLRR
jgi:hypothetical protein